MDEYQTLAVLITVCSAVQAADLGMFGATIKALEEYFSIDPIYLGIVFLCQGLAHAVTSPFWGMLADRYDRIMLLCACLLGLSILTGMTGLAQTYRMLCLARFFTGVFSAGIGPVTQTMLASAVSADDRSKFFSYVVVATQVGGSIGAVYGASMSHVQILDRSGWRFTLITMSLISLTVAASLYLMRASLQKVLSRALVLSNKGRSSMWADFLTIFGRTSFILLLIQGAFASTGSAAGYFLIEILQYAGFQDIDASYLLGFIAAGNLVGALGTGYAADMCAKRDPEKGRILYGMVGNLCLMTMLVVFSVGGGVRILNKDHYYELAVCCFLSGMFQLFAYVGVVKPFLAEVVPKRITGQAYAYAAGVDGAVAAIVGAPLVALISQRHYNYQPTDVTIQGMDDDLRQNNLLALANAYVIVTFICTLGSSLILVGLLKTYLRDKRASETEDEMGNEAYRQSDYRHYGTAT